MLEREREKEKRGKKNLMSGTRHTKAEETDSEVEDRHPGLVTKVLREGASTLSHVPQKAVSLTVREMLDCLRSVLRENHARHCVLVQLWCNIGRNLFSKHVFVQVWFAWNALHLGWLES